MSFRRRSIVFPGRALAGIAALGIALAAGCGTRSEPPAQPVADAAALTFTASPIRGVQSNRCLDINGQSTANGTQAQLWDCNGGTNQSWTFDSSTTRYLVVYGNKCLQASGGGTATGTAVVIGDCTGQAFQQWNVDADQTITNVQSGLCMDASGAGTANGTRIILWTCGTGTNQRWTVSGAVASQALTVAKGGTGVGTVTSTPAGIACGSTCSASYASGTSVTLTAAAASGSTFGGWSGACGGTSSICTVAMSAARSVTATFNPGSTGTTVSVNAGGAASGSFVADAYSSGGSTYSVTSAVDTSQLTGAVPAQAVLQTERYGEFTYTIPGFAPSSAQTVTLYFDEVYWTAAGQRTFDVAINGANVLRAFDIFAAAGGANRAIARTFTTTADAGGNVAVAFTKGGGPDNPKVCGITVAPGGGTTTYSLTIAASAGGSTSPAPGTYVHPAGSAVAVTATAASGYAFTGWSGAATGTANPVTVTVDADRTLTANFTQSTTTPGTARQAYDGARGKLFDDGWRFFRGDASGAQQPSFDDGSWRSLSVPHDWSIELSFNQGSPSGAGGGYLDGGVGWYRKTFTLDPSYAGKRILISFDGVYMNSQVWINGTSLGTRPYGYSTFQYDITPYVRTDGTSNVVAVRVNNNQPNSRWYSGSGIYRNVWLTALDPVHVAYNGAFVTTPSVSPGSGSVSVATEVENKGSASQTVTVRTGIYDANGTLVTSATSGATGVAANGRSTVNQGLTVSSPRLWSPDSPNLYQVKVEVLVGGTTVDTYLSPLGFRWFSFSATGGMSFNGGSMKMRGTCNHHDLGALGAAFNTRAMERQLQTLKAMGINALRTSHNPPAPELLDLADRLGFVVMDEAFDCWESGKTANDYHLYFGQWAQTDLQDLVRRDRNHPSVIMWSIGNEIPNPSVATATNLRNWARAVDSTRPVTWNNMDVLGSVASQVASVLDLQGFSYNSWQYDAGHSQHPDWKIFGSESSSAVRSRGIYKTPTNQNILTGSDTQCSSYDNSVVSWGASAENAYRDDTNRTWISGEFIWTGFDYIGEPTPYSWPAKSSYFGICDTAGFPKDIYYFYKSKWTTAPTVHLLPHWNHSVGTTVPVWAYSNCDSVELFLNDASQGSRTVSSTTMHVEWSVPWASGTLRADCRRGGSVVASDTVRTAGSATQVKLTADRTTIAADGRDLVYVTADLQDASGVIVPTAANGVTFAVSGPGRIVGVDNGNAIDTTSYTSPTRKAFSGKVLAIVQSTGAAGTITVTATSSGLAAGSVSATAR
jgi:beta-galactosidase